MTAPAAETRALAGSADGLAPVRGVSLRLDAGALVALTGPPGAGKTSLLRLLAGLASPVAGWARVGGEPAGPGLVRRGTVAVLDPAVLVHLRVLDNLTLPPALAGRRLDPARAELGLRRAGLGRRRGDRAAALGALDRRRVAVTRASAGRPALLLADEPARDLEPADGAAIVALLRATAREDGCTVLVATRDAGLAAQADRTVSLEAGRVVPGPRASAGAGM